MNKKPRIVVVGDVMLDIYRYGDVDRISPEAPVPIIHVKKSEKSLGGAGNTFANLYALDAHSSLVGLIGRDHYGSVELPSLIHKKYPSANYHFQSIQNFCTIIKERVIARGQQICRLDWEITEPELYDEEKSITVKILTDFLLGCDVLIISDYAKGFINEFTMRLIHDMKEREKFIVILDPHPKNAWLYTDIDYATPNKKEFDEIKSAAFWEMGCEAIIRTEGADGMSIIPKNGTIHHFNTVAQEIFDVSGAGDTVSAILGYMLAHRFGLVQAVTVANECAGVVVAKPGTVPIKRDEFNKIMRRIK